MTKMTAAHLEALRRRSKEQTMQDELKATPGPWSAGNEAILMKIDRNHPWSSTVFYSHHDGLEADALVAMTFGATAEQADANARLVAAARAPDPALAAAQSEVVVLKGLLTEIVPSRLIGESHVPYPEGKTTILMRWEWLKRARAALVQP
jgi:hypothetical protein